ncbi:hypothetical protein FPCIR_12214 [Fusarium pseudocircinatum]|uniref:Uncharacterized protein n=1 Tax=Fusarium pseudocircinatum TaxID=56676 RepID=A0A8H5KRD9_9HYPO|nr:hypothetical protein FPCIR_12214 [Fusarium pseudocircinatum]
MRKLPPNIRGPADHALCEFGEATVSAGYPGDLVSDVGEGLLEEYKGWAVAARLLIDIHAEWSEEPESSPLEHWVERFLMKEKDFGTLQVADYHGWALQEVQSNHGRPAS